MSRKVFLILEELDDLALIIDHALASLGYEVTVFEPYDNVLEAIEQKPPDLAIIKMVQRGFERMDLLKAVRAQSDCFLFLISAQASELECILALELGADDYLGGPFSLRQLLARVKAFFRRYDRQAIPVVEPPKAKGLVYDDLRLDIANGVLRRGKLETALTLSEVFILERMMHSPARVFNRHELLQESLGSRDGSRAVDMHIANLRKKISNLGVSFAPIRAVRGKGYRFRDGDGAPKIECAQDELDPPGH